MISIQDANVAVRKYLELTMVEVSIVITLREVILRGAPHVLRAAGTKRVQSLQLDSAVPNRRRALRACLIWDIRPSTDTTT